MIGTSLPLQADELFALGIVAIFMLLLGLFLLRREESYLLRVRADAIELEKRRGSRLIGKAEHFKASLIGVLVEVQPFPHGDRRSQPSSVSLMLDEPELPLLLEACWAPAAEDAQSEAAGLLDRLKTNLHGRLPGDSVGTGEHSWRSLAQP